MLHTGNLHIELQRASRLLRSLMGCPCVSLLQVWHTKCHTAWVQTPCRRLHLAEDFLVWPTFGRFVARSQIPKLEFDSKTKLTRPLPVRCPFFLILLLLTWFMSSCVLDLWFKGNFGAILMAIIYSFVWHRPRRRGSNVYLLLTKLCSLHSLPC